MSRTNNKRFFKDQWRFSKSDPNQLQLPLDEDLIDYLSRDKDEMRQAQDEFDTATVDGPNDRITVERKLKVGAEYEILSVEFAAEGIPTYVKRNDPPTRAEMLLHFGLPKRDRECMIGDLEEEYRRVILPKYGGRVAARWYWWQAVRSVIAASGGRVRVWLSFGGLTRATGWIVEKFGL